MEAEIVGDVDALIETLTPIGPYAYAIKPEIHADGGVHIPIETTREGIHEWYKVIRGESSLLPGWNLVEVRGQWYTFFEAVTRARRRDGDDTVYETETIALLPVTSRSGITGELVWFRVPIASGQADGAAPTAGLAARKQLLEAHDRHLGAIREGDVEAVVATMSPRGEVAIRDLVNATGTLIGLRNHDDVRAYHTAFFDTFDVQAVDILYRTAQDWYVFAEVQFTAKVRTGTGAGASQRFRVAEFFVGDGQGRFIARIGHATDPT